MILRNGLLFCLWALAILGISACTTTLRSLPERTYTSCVNPGDCALRIRNAVAQNWSRPLDFAGDWREMEVKVRLELDDLYNVTSTEIVHSSGHGGFDQTALDAIFKAQPFYELRGLERDTYEKMFRNFTVTFRPEDLY